MSRLRLGFPILLLNQDFLVCYCDGSYQYDLLNCGLVLAVRRETLLLLFANRSDKTFVTTNYDRWLDHVPSLCASLKTLFAPKIFFA